MRRASSGAGPQIGFRPYDQEGRIASSRLRAFLPARHLRDAGWSTAIVPPDGRGDYDCVIFQKPYGPADLELAERLAAKGVKVIVDVYDNLFHNPEGLAKVDERAERLRRMIDLADAVTVSVAGLIDCVAARAPSFVVNDAVDDFEPRAPHGVHAPVRVVWFGNSASPGQPFGMYFLGAVLPGLERLSHDIPVELTVISNSRALYDQLVAPARLTTRYVEWKLRRFARAFSRNDVCVLPIESNPLTSHKSNNRLVIALQLGVPVIASPIPSYLEFGEWILFEGWEEHVGRYATEADLRAAHVTGAQAYLREAYGPRRVVSDWEQPLRALFP